MNRIVALCLSATLLMSLYACKDKKDDSTPSSTTSGNNKQDVLSAQVGVLPFRAFSCQATVNGGVLTIEGQSGNQQLEIKVLANSPGTYPIEGTNPNVSASYQNNSGVQFSSLIGGSGTLIVSVFNDNQIKGTFVCNDLENTTGGTVSITNGVFDIERRISFEIYFPTGPEPIYVMQGLESQVGLGEVRLFDGPIETVNLSFDQLPDGLSITPTQASGQPPFNFALRILPGLTTPKGNHVVKLIGESTSGVKESIDLKLDVALHPTIPLEGTYTVSNNSSAPASLGLPTSYTDQVVRDPSTFNDLILRNFLNFSNVNVYATVSPGIGGQDNQITIKEKNLTNGDRLVTLSAGDINVVGNGGPGTTFDIVYTYWDGPSGWGGRATYTKQ